MGQGHGLGSSFTRIVLYRDPPDLDSQLHTDFIVIRNRQYQPRLFRLFAVLWYFVLCGLFAMQCSRLAGLYRFR